LRKETISLVMSVHPSFLVELGSHWTDFHEIQYLRIFRKSVAKIQVSLKSDKNKGDFTWKQYTFFIISHSFLLRMRNISDKRCRENQITYFVFSDFFFCKNGVVYEKMGKNIVERGIQQVIIWRIRIACWVPKATNTNTQVV